MSPKLLGKNARPMIFGEVLYDLFPDNREIPGGAPFNVAMHLAAFGEKPWMVSRVGDDNRGERITQRMKSWGMDTQFIQQDREHETGVVSVTIKRGEPVYKIIPGVAWDFIEEPPEEKLPDRKQVALLYQGTLALRNLHSRTSFEAVQKKLSAPAFVDLNLRRPWYNVERIDKACSTAKWLKLNRAELHEIVGTGLQSVEKDLIKLRQRWNIPTIIVTDGKNGAYISEKGKPAVGISPKRVRGVVDTVGAGDGFSAVTLLGLLRGWPLDVTMERAVEFASRICQINGALPPSHEWYSETLNSWNEKHDKRSKR